MTFKYIFASELMGPLQNVFQWYRNIHWSKPGCVTCGCWEWSSL